MKTYKIGTRGSLLAVTQSTLMKCELEKISGDSFELVLIKTQGDEITNKPLWQLEGKDFFTKELDEALLNKKVDLVIHSYKDLGSERPQGIKLGAVTKRTFSQDILLIPKKNVKLLSQWKGDFQVGTSSPRRITNIGEHLKDYLPGSIEVRCEMLRGNVNTRIQKLRDGKYHAIVLALAGLERLAQLEESAHELKNLLFEMNYLVLPQTIFPSAASQGALGIELLADRSDGGELLKIVSQLTHPPTLEEVSRERKSFQEFGGGCHLAMGIHVKKIADDLFLHIHAGSIEEKRIEKKWMEGLKLPRLEKGKTLFVGLPSGKKSEVVYDEYLKKVPKEKSLDLSHQHVFVTSRYCLETLLASTPPEGLWAPGTKTARDLVRRGFWINGVADCLGGADLEVLKSSRALKLMHENLTSNWVVLTHENSESDLGRVIGCYERMAQSVSEEFEARLKNVGACYWTSFPQYLSYMERFPYLKNLPHFCGLGKTWQEFKKHQLTIFPIGDMQEFYKLSEYHHEQ